MEALFIVFRDNLNMKLNGVTEIDRRNIKGIVKKITAFDCFLTAMLILVLLLCLLKLYETLHCRRVDYVVYVAMFSLYQCTLFH